MTINKVLKKFVGVNEIRINSLNLDKTADGSDKLVIHVEPYKSKQCRCPLCTNDKKNKFKYFRFCTFYILLSVSDGQSFIYSLSDKVNGLIV